ncbi:MAG TPA: tetratricopeptide repeat protein [Thermoanaerobaculia bacterium]|jgi:tetratricopeptide (TPR) repeat protein|nr:tetratricopeptide repeat protein [Thermoanaerobaculia bacterium]
MRSRRASPSDGSKRWRWQGPGAGTSLVVAFAFVCASASRLGAAEALATPPPATVIVPFAIDESAARWAHATVPMHMAPLDRLRRLSRALLDPALRPIAEAAHTSTASDVFGERRANCVGYANLFVGLARELGVAAYFVLVDGLPASGGTSADESLAVREGHLAAAWGPAVDRRIFDLAGETPGTRLRVRPITDLAAIAVFYSNRGVEALLDGRTGDAVDWLRIAAELEPTALPSTWINLGVALRRNGDLEAANEAYQRALELDPGGAPAYRNLAALLVLRGRGREAAELLDTAAAIAGTEARLDSLAALRLAQQRLLAGHLQEARGLYSRALEGAQVAPRR